MQTTRFLRSFQAAFGVFQTVYRVIGDRRFLYRQYAEFF